MSAPHNTLQMSGSTTFTPTYLNLVNEGQFVSFSATAPATTDGMNPIVKFVTDGYTRPAAAGGQIGRSLFVKAEDVSFIRELQLQILGLAQSSQSYVTELLLPAQMTRDTKIKWTTMRFQATPLTRNPALGVNYTHDRTTTQNEASADRSGIHFEIEGDAWYTDAGQRDFQMNMAYWAVCLTETMAMRAWTELVRPRVETRRSYFNTMLNSQSYNQAIVKERDDMFVSYKFSNGKGIYRLIQENCELISTNTGKEATIMVMPRDKSALVTNGTNMTNYKNGGERGLDLLISKGFLGEIVPGLSVYTAPKFVTDPAFEPTTPLDSERRFGSYAGNVKFARDLENGKELDFEAGRCLDKFYDENEDRWKELPSLAVALEDSGRFVVTETAGVKYGTVIVPTESPEAMGDTTDPFYNYYGLDEAARTKRMNAWATELNGSRAAAGTARFMVAAPFAGYRTQGVLTAASGMDAGITTMSEPIITKGEDAMTQVFKFNMTVWTGAYIFDPRRFLVSYNAFYNGIIGGGGVTLINSVQAERLKSETEWEDNRINRPSMYFMVVSKKGEYDPDFIDLRGKTRFGSDAEPSYPSSAYYKWKYGFEQIEDSADEYARQPIAPVCFRREYNRWNGTKYSYEAGETPHGRVVGVGSREMRRYGRCIVDDIITEASRD